MASRSLKIFLDVERADPENRKFKHPDPVGWTLNMRAEILGALYTILLGNPFLDQRRDAPCETRFKMWWRLVGSAIEHAAKLANPDKPVRFKDLFLEQEAEDEESGDLTQVLSVLAKQFPTTFKAAEVAELVNNRSDVVGKLLREFLYPDIRDDAVVV
jgi:hypothetical protein